VVGEGRVLGEMVLALLWVKIVDSVSDLVFEGGQDRLKKRWGQIDKVFQFAFDSCDIV
jgi:hypothetical protein